MSGPRSWWDLVFFVPLGVLLAIAAHQMESATDVALFVIAVLYFGERVGARVREWKS